MSENETYYGNFAEPKENKQSARSEEVVLTALDRCQELETKLMVACTLLSKLVSDMDAAKRFLEAVKEK